ncbi:MAG: T9SS type B sorting domain-containing protein [Flavobacteriales bacterium]|nr:T9SS type B sorting domain-containing protein [Flavobacteriales bacterium]
MFSPKRFHLILMLLAMLMARGKEAFSQCGPLTTIYAGNNGQDGIMFDITAINSVNITHFDIDAYGNTHNYEIYHKVGTHVGFETNGGAWTLLGTAGNVPGNPRNSPTAVPINFSVHMCPGERHAFYITSTSTSASVSYTNGTGVGNIAASDANIQIREGTGKDYPFNTSYTPRIPNITCYYNCTQSCCEPPTINPTATSCQGACDGSATASAGAGSVAPYTYQWNAATGNQTGTTASSLCTGSYSVTVTDATGCVATSSTVVPSGPPITVPSISPAGPFCETQGNQTLYASVSGGTWSGNGITNASAGTFSPSAAGPGTWTITYSLPGQCGSSSTTTITVNAQADASIIPAGPFCVSDAPVNLSAATPGGSWSGNGIINSTTGTFQPSIAGVGTWNIQYQINGSCGATDSESITVTAGADATITTAGSYCENVTPFNLTALSPGGTWSGPGIVDAATGLWDPSVAGPGTWTVTYTIPAPCGDTDDATLTVTPGADASITPAGPFCLNDAPVVLSAADPGGTWVGAGITNANTGAFDPGTAGVGTWTILYTIPGACGQSQSTQISVSNGYDATINAVPIQCTTGSPITLTAANAGGTWSGPGITDGLAGTFDPSVAGPGNHIIHYDIPGGCGDSDVRVITVNQGADATIDPIPTLCTNSPIMNLTAASPGGSWSGTGIINPSAGTFFPGAVSPGTWTVTYNITGSCGDIDTETITIEPVGNPTITPVPPMCSDGLNITMTAATAGGTWSGTGITNPSTGSFSPAVAGPGNWTITYTLPGACGGTDTEVVTVSPPIVLNTTVDQQSHCGQPDGIISVSASGGTVANGYSYTWSTSPAQTAATASGLGPGNYAVTVTDDLGCTASSSVTVTPTTGFTASVSSTTDVSCAQSCDGTATVTAGAGSIGALTYSWNTTPAQTGATATNLCAGNYDVTVTDNVGCSTIASGTVGAPPSFTAAASNSGSPICFGESATLNVTASGGATPYASYSWSASPSDPTLTSPNSQSPTVSPTGYTTYTATVTDANGCTTTAQTSVDRGTEIILTPELIQQSNCGQPDGIITVNVTGGFVDSTYTYLWDTTPAETTDTVTGLVAGTYNVTVTDDVGCSATTSVTVTTSAGFTASVDTYNDVSCYSLCDGDATVTITGNSVAPLSYSWNTTPAQTTATATNLCAGSYDVTVTDNTGCSATASVTITEPAELTITAAASLTQLCEGESSDLTSSASGGAAPITYSWAASPADASLTASQQNPTVSPTATTTYTVTATDAGGCTATEQVTVNVSPAIVLNAVMDQQSNCGQADGAVSVTASGGTVATDYSYSWDSSPTQNTAAATGLLPGTYNVTVTDDVGCSETASAVVTSSAGFTASVDTYNDVSCYSLCDGDATVTITGNSVSPLAYSWNTTPAQTTATATNLCAGSYDVTVTDNTGCSATASVTITEPAELTITAAASLTQLCEGESSDLTSSASGGAAPIAYSWAASPADASLTASQQNPTVSPTATTTYTVTATDGNGCTATEQVTVDVSPAITLNAVMDQQSNCGQADGAVSVTASGGTVANDYSYSWDSSPAQNTAAATGLLPGTYNVTVTDDVGCSETASAVVTSSAGFTASVDTYNDVSCYSLCDGDATVTITGNAVSPLAYSWNTTPAQTTATATNLCAGSYDVTVTDNTGCSATASVTISEPAELTITAAASLTQLCEGESSDLTSSASGGAAPIAYSWAASPADASLTASQQNPTVSPTATTTYTVTATDGNGCTATEQVTVNVSPAIVLNAVMDQQSNCGQADGAVSVTALGGTVANDYSYSWDSSPAQNTAAATGLLPGTYNVTVTDDVGCSETASAVVTSSAGFTASIDTYNDVSCYSLCDGDATVTITGNAVSPLAYSWNTTPAQTTATATNLCAGSYDVTVTDNTGCMAMASVTIAEPAALTVTAAASSTLLCGGQSSDLTATVSGGNQPTFSWTATPADATLNGSTQNPTVTPTANTVYEVTVTDGGCTATDQVSVNVSPGITLNATMDQQSNCGQSDGIVSVAASGGTVANDYGYSWDSSPAQTTASATGLPPGTYTVTVTDDAGCTETASVDVITSGGFAASISAQTDANCYQGCDGAATVVADANAIAPLTYAWNTTPAQSTATATGLCAGTIDVTVTDNVGCVATTSVTIAEPTAFEVTVSASSPTVCTGGSTDLSAATTGGNQTNVTYSWSASPADPSLNASAQNPTVSPTASTVYTVTATDGNGCTATDQITIDIAASLTVNVTLDQQAACGQATGVATAIASGGTVAVDYAYGWNTTPAQTTATATGLAPGTYTVVALDDAGCTGSADITVTTSAGFTASISASTDATCYQACDGTATVAEDANAVAPVTYSWNTTPAQTTATATNLCAGNYDVTLTDAAGCVTTASVTINEPTELTATAAASQATICGGGTSDLSAIGAGGTGPYTYSWSATPADASLSASQQNPTVSPTANTTYTVTVADDNGCSATDQTSVSISPAISPSAVMNQESNCGQADGEATASATGGSVANDYAYSWNSTPTQTTATATGLLPGTYTVTITDDIGCSATADVDITTTSGFTASITGSTDANCFQGCDGTATVQESAGAVAPVIYAWGTVPPQLSATATNLCAGTYQVLVSDATGCTANASVTIAEPTELEATADASVTQVCIGQSVDLTASAVGGTTPYVSYSWTATPTDASLNTTQQNPTVSPTANTTYEVTVTDANGCTASKQVSVSVLSALTLNVVTPSSSPDTSICPGSTATINLSASGGDGNYSYYLQPDLTNPVSLPMAVQPNATTTYDFVVTDGCTTPSSSASSTISIFSLPQIDISGGDAGCHVHSVQLADNTVPTPTSWNWNFGDPQSSSNTSSSSSPSHTFSNPGLYDISLSIVTADGCSVDTTLTDYVEVYPLPVADFNLDPNVVSVVDGTITFTDQSSGNIDTWNWNFGTGDSSIVQNPVYTYTDTGSFIVQLTVTTVNGCQSTTRGSVKVTPVFTFYIPNSFTPNGDGVNDFFQPYGEGVDWNTFSMEIFNRWGDKIYVTNDIGHPWDGTMNGHPAEMGVYVWSISIRQTKNMMHYYHGHVNLLR